MTLGPPLSDEDVKLLCVDDTLLRGVVEADGGEEEKEDDGDGGRRGLLMFFGVPFFFEEEKRGIRSDDVRG